MFALPPIPDYLVGIIIVLVVLPSLAAILLRFVLNLYLDSLGSRVRKLIYQQTSKKPSIVQDLESRFAQGSSKLEQVNTPALIAQVYSRQRLGLIHCEQIDLFCRILPNLLLSFGLLGTFIGITINLTSLSETVSDTSATDISSLLTELQAPLQGMGIAFTTSLVAIFFSAILTAVNFLFNTNLSKYRLLNLLEDYLDNVYLQTLAGETQLDKVVKAVAYSFDGFLNKFGETITVAVQSALQDKVQQIYDANSQATKLAEETYLRMAEAATTIARSAQEFQIASDRFIEVARSFEQSQFPQKLSMATSELGNIQKNFSQSASNLAASVQAIEIVTLELQGYSKRLVKFGEDISKSNETSLRVLESNQQNQQDLSETIRQMQESSQGFQVATNTLDSLQRRVVAKAENLDDISTDLRQMLEGLNNYTQSVTGGINSLGDRLSEGMTYQANANSTQLKLIAKNLLECVEQMEGTKAEMSALRQSLERVK
ncbi:MAG: hypothetical protein SXA11_19000 [Cyanobacteriota bacterium]|nr:hypothetical protein [Cyanobacteriota bacterium]